MKKMNTILRKTSSTKNICRLFLASHLVLLVMMTVTLPVINNQIGTKVFDLQAFGYSVSMAETIVQNLDQQTALLYLIPQLLILDFLYPILLALFLSSLLFRLFSLTNTNNQKRSILLIIPFLAMTFDYIENVFIVQMITRSVDLSEAIVFSSSVSTVMKGLLTSIAWTSALFYALKWLRMNYLDRQSKEAQTQSAEQNSRQDLFRTRTTDQQ